MMTPTKYFYAFIDSLLSIFRVLLRITHRSKVQKTGQANLISILANGPSLKKETPESIEGDKLAVNYFASTPKFMRFQPDYYIFVAPEFWAADADDHTKKLVKQLIDNLIQKVNWPLTLFIPQTAGRYFDFIEKENNHIKIQRFSTTPVEGYKKIIHFLFSLQLGMPRPHNVLVPSLMVSIWMDYKTIKVYGADHSWLPLLQVDDDNNALLEQKHFYDEGKTKASLMRKDAKFRNGRKLHEILEKFYLSFKAYHIIEAFAKKKGIKIYNSTPNSFIDAFERKR